MTARVAEVPPRSLNLNIAANYAGQLYTGLIGIAMVPVYLRMMTAEAYGLVGFFALLQAWAQLLDLGLSATVTREAARFGAGKRDVRGFRDLLRSFEWFFWPLGLLLAAVLAWQAQAISHSWLD